MDYKITIIATIIGAILSAILTIVIDKYIWKIKFKINKDEALLSYKKRGRRIFLFKTQAPTRISVGVLATIKKDNTFLTFKSSRDNQWKPLGGVLKLNDAQIKILKKDVGNFAFDHSTKYKAKGNEFRITNVRISNNKKIMNFIDKNFSIDNLKEQLKREMCEELQIAFHKFGKIFKIINSKREHSRAIESLDSILQIRELLHQIIFDVKVIDQNVLDQIVDSKQSLQWVDITKNKKNIAITNNWVAN